MAYKFKYLIFNEIPFNRGITVAQVDVSLLNKKSINNKWTELESIFPNDKFQSSLREQGFEMREFINVPKPVNGGTEKE